VPASTAKLLTSAAALDVLGPQTTLSTRVVTGATADEIVLVGGGDALLGKGLNDPDAVVGHAGLTTLAKRTAASLRAAGQTTVAVRLDDSIFSGPRISPRWASTDVAQGYVAPIAPIAIKAGSIGEGAYPRRSPDPAMSAASTFADLLDKQPGIRVTGSVARVKAQKDADVLGKVESAPLGDVVEHVLQHSDNTVAEVLARLVARATERPATFADAGVAVLDRIALLGVPVDGAKLTGGSGLGSGSVLSTRTLTGVLAAASSTEHPELRPLLSGMPIAAATGTLSERFDEKDDRAAGGVLRAKTGTLTGVHSLAGSVVDADGRLLIFAVLAGGKNQTVARAALDDFASKLATCGCR
jgi:D-alanyl-D-alanine carboxypeptidase/D-alanyl-D-alanine-endopeptidase (penicillin-binding protein 4)